MANSGRYRVEGDEIVTQAYVAKDPNYQNAFPENEARLPFEVDGNSMTLEWAVFEFELQKVEGMQMGG